MVSPTRHQGLAADGGSAAIKRALFVMSIPNYTREVGPVADYFDRRGVEVHVLVGWAGPTAEAYARERAAAGFVVHHVPEALKYVPDVPARTADLGAPPAPTPPSRLRRLRQIVGAALYSRLGFVRTVRRMWQTRRFGVALVAAIDPDVVLASSYGNTVGSFDQAIGLAVHRARIPYFCVPHTPNLGEKGAIQNRFNWAAQSRSARQWYAGRSPMTRALARRFPHWTRTVDGLTLFRLDPLEMLAAWVVGLVSANPWQQPSELFDRCFVESDFSRDLLVDSGYPSAKVTAAGKPLLDQVFARIGDRDYELDLYDTLGVEPGTPFLLCNVEPSAEHAYASWDEHWTRFHSLMRCLREADTEVVLSLHPLCAPPDYAFVEQEYGFTIASRHKIVELYPYCGLVVSFPCSTNPLNLVFEKPLVIYDFFGLTRPEAVGSERLRLPGARIAFDSEGVLAAVDEILRTLPSTAATGAKGSAATHACQSILREAETFVASARSGGLRGRW